MMSGSPERRTIRVPADLRRLKQFVVLAEMLNVSRAAERLNIAQPALSVSIRKLEEELGLALFVREARGVTLTLAGREALEEAQRTLFHADQFARRAWETAEGTGGDLRIGFVTSATYGLLQRLIPQYRAAFPGVTLELREAAGSGPILEWLQREQVDIGIVRTPIVSGVPATLLPLQEDHFVAALPSLHPALGRRELRLSDLADEPFVMYRQAEAPGMRSAAMLACQQAGFLPQIAQEAAQVTTVLALVESGLGVGLIPSIMQLHGGRQVTYRVLADAPEAARVGLSLALHPDRHIPAARHFWEMASAATFDSRDTAEA
jgi:DNA-binding transcriptional LysR family regulator